MKTLCTSKECLLRFSCGRWEENYNKSVFERVRKSDLLEACENSNYENKEDKDDMQEMR
jgi:hypothetical protein